ncbi:hypothetical protein PtB15_4B868 [Puccinia triticina]|nr:hypothetical protein PtB15_4B868 [Puccinia triticina]
MHVQFAEEAGAADFLIVAAEESSGPPPSSQAPSSLHQPNQLASFFRSTGTRLHRTDIPSARRHMLRQAWA